MSESSSNQTNGSAASEKSLPLFYKQPEPLRSDLHANFGLQPTGTFEFARETNSIPLTVAEFPLAARHYPIVFVGQDTPMPAAIVGLRKDENLMVYESGAWAEGHYIPAYVRRYPFAFVQDAEKTKFALCVDFGSGLVSEGAEVPLFKDGEPADITQKALEFCKTLQQRVNGTRVVGKALADSGLLANHSGEFTLPSGEKLNLARLMIVNEAKFRELDDDAFLALRKNGALTAIYCHLLSMNNWDNLTRRA